MAKWIKQDPIYLQKSKQLQARNLGCSAVSNWINNTRMRHLGTDGIGTNKNTTSSF